MKRPAARGSFFAPIIPKFVPSTNTMKKTALIVLDGWGRADNPDVSAIDKANTPFVDSLYKDYPQTWVKTSGQT